MGKAQDAEFPERPQAEADPARAAAKQGEAAAGQAGAATEQTRADAGQTRVAGQTGAASGQARRDASLNALVRTEAHRVLSENMLQPDPARVADGWERRFVADGKRAEEAIALYEELGYEVCADPVRSEELRNECDACRLVALLRFQTIYTRRRAEDAAAG